MEQHERVSERKKYQPSQAIDPHVRCLTIADLKEIFRDVGIETHKVENVTGYKAIYRGQTVYSGTLRGLAFQIWMHFREVAVVNDVIRATKVSLARHLYPHCSESDAVEMYGQSFILTVADIYERSGIARESEVDIERLIIDILKELGYGRSASKRETSSGSCPGLDG